MKRVLQFSLAALVFGQITAHAGIGTVFVQNNNGGTIVPLFDGDGRTILKGDNYSVGVFVNNGGYGGSLGAQVGSIMSLDARNGRFNGGLQEVPGSLAGGTASLIVVAWDNRFGVDYNSAVVRGQSVPFQSPTLGGDVDDNPSTPAATALSMALNFKSFAFQIIPEPSALAMAALGLGGLLFISCRK